MTDMKMISRQCSTGNSKIWD